MIILALDPSLTRTGYALFEAEPIGHPERPRLLDAGHLRPPGQRQGRKLSSIERMRALGDDLRDLIRGPVGAVVIEVTSGKVNRARHGGAGAGLATYGQTVGYMLGLCEQCLGVHDVHPIYENDWIGKRNGGPPARKALRPALVRTYFPDVTYDPADDPGADAADAILLGRWFCLHRLPGVLTAQAQRAKGGE